MHQLPQIRRDLTARRLLELNLRSATPKGEFTPGLEFSGVVTKAGSDTDFSAGERVMGATRFGGYSTDLNIDSRYVRRLPEGWDFRQGAGFLTQCLTAWYGRPMLLLKTITRVYLFNGYFIFPK